MNLLHGDCLELMKTIESGSVDLILTDPPYGTMNTDGGRKMNINGWDNILDYDLMWSEINRILRKNGKCILFSQEPFTSDLIKSVIPNVPFSMRAIWLKDNFANALGVNKNLVNFYEDICLFSKKACYEAKHPLKEMFFEIYQKYGKEDCKNAMRTSGRFSSEQSVSFHTSIKFGYGNGMVFELMVEDLYNHIKKTINIPYTYQELKAIDNQFKKQFASTFNLWQGGKYKSNVFEYKKDYDGYHPTQKPVALLEDLIKTYSNENNLVLDFTMGSGSTGVACVNTNRKFIGIEKDDKYFEIAKNRIEQHIPPML